MSYGGFEYGGNDLMSGPLTGGFLGVDDQTIKQENKKSSREKQSLLPITIKQFNESIYENDTYKIDGIDLYTVKILGIIDSIQENSTISTYYLNDGTGIVECRHFRTDQAPNPQSELFRENSLVQVIANPREYEGRKHLNIYDIKLITDWNELTLHFLESIFIHLQNTKGSVPSPTPISIPHSPITTYNKAPSNSIFSISRSLKQESNTLKDNVFGAIRLLKGTAGEEGVGLQEILQHLQQQNPSLTYEHVRHEAQNLADQALVYATVDDYHFLPTDPNS